MERFLIRAWLAVLFPVLILYGLAYWLFTDESSVRDALKEFLKQKDTQ